MAENPLIRLDHPEGDGFAGLIAVCWRHSTGKREQGQQSGVKASKTGYHAAGNGPHAIGDVGSATTRRASACRAAAR